MQNSLKIVLILWLGAMITSCKTTESLSESRDVIVITNNKPTKVEMRTDVDLMAHQAQPVTELIWDKWGVPHIYAKDNDDLFYSFGYAQMHSHANTILKLYAHSRGRAMEYFGSDAMENDLMVNALNIPSTARTWYDLQTPEFKGYIDQFVKGMNDYAAQNKNAVSDEYKMILPIEKHDVLSHAMFVLYSRFIGGDQLQSASRLAERGSNTYAVGPSHSASGNAMLVMNPHLPWFDEWLFYEGHFNAPGVHIYGATLVGLPTLGIAFNENLGWSHTNNTIDNADLYELKLEDNGYVVDGQNRPFNVRKANLKIKQDDGSLKVQEFEFLSSDDFGNVISQENGKAYSLKMPGYDRPYGIVQWWKMGTAKNLSEFKDALKEVQIPFFNIMYADRDKNIFYMFNGQVPRRKTGDWNYWSGVVDGTKSENIWTDVLSYDELPKLENPKTGWLQNANDPPWTSTYPPLLDPAKYPAYVSPISMSFRPQRAVRMMTEDNSITFDELVADKLSTHLEMADRFLDDLDKAVAQYGDQNAIEGMKVLNAWDREADGDSKGMALFYSWAHTLGTWKSSNYSNNWNLKDPMTEPQSLANMQEAAKVLSGVVAQFKENKIPLDIEWGQQYRIKYNGKEYPGNGADGSVGIFRVAWSNGLEDDGKYYISGGDSWQSIIEFGDKIHAKVLLSYGNSTQPDSRNNGDQLELFSKKQMRECTFYKTDVLKNIALKESLIDGRFVIRK